MSDYDEDFVKSIGSGELSKLIQNSTIDHIDGVIDKAFRDSKLLEQFPFLKYLKAGYEDIKAGHQRIYLRKIFKFWFQVDKASDSSKDKYRKKLTDDPQEVRKAGEAVWEILDSISSSEKAPMLGKVFQAYMAGEINADQVVYLCEMIDKSYLYDLKAIETGESTLNRTNLINIGFFEPINYKKVIDDDLSLTMRGIASSPISMQRTNHTPEGKWLDRILRTY